MNIEKLLTARYKSDIKKILCIENPNNVQMRTVLKQLISQIKIAAVQCQSTLFPKYFIPENIKINNQFIRDIILSKAEKLAASPNISGIEIQEFLLEFHEFIKYSLGQWFLVNPGVLIEIIPIPDFIPARIVNWMRKYDSEINKDSIILHPHIISNSGRSRLKSVGFEIKYNREDGSYYFAKELYLDFLYNAKKIISQSECIKGIFVEGTWMLDPNLFPENGKNIAAFDFYKDKKLIGHRIKIERMELPDGEYEKQIGFATRSQTRKRLFDSGQYGVDVYCGYYPQFELIGQNNNKC
jgi:hypothetical protein